MIETLTQMIYKPTEVAAPAPPAPEVPASAPAPETSRSVASIAAEYEAELSRFSPTPIASPEPIAAPAPEVPAPAPMAAPAPRRRTETEYMKFKKTRVDEIIRNSKQSGTIYSEVLTKQKAGRIAKFEWQRDNSKGPFSRYNTRDYKAMMNCVFSDFRYPEVTEVPPPAADKTNYRNFAYIYLMDMFVDFFTKFTTIYSSFANNTVQRNFLRLKFWFCSLTNRSPLNTREYSSYVFPSWVLDAETQQQERERQARIRRQQARQARLQSSLTREFERFIYRYRSLGVNVDPGLLRRMPRSLANAAAPTIPKAKLMPVHIKNDIVRLKEMAGEKMDDCPICLCELDSEFVITHCGHAYCKGCMDNLLKSSIERSSSRVCSVCRQGILA